MNSQNLSNLYISNVSPQGTDSNLALWSVSPYIFAETNPIARKLVGSLRNHVRALQTAINLKSSIALQQSQRERAGNLPNVPQTLTLWQKDERGTTMSTIFLAGENCASPRSTGLGGAKFTLKAILKV